MNRPNEPGGAAPETAPLVGAALFNGKYRTIAPELSGPWEPLHKSTLNPQPPGLDLPAYKLGFEAQFIGAQEPRYQLYFRNAGEQLELVFRLDHAANLCAKHLRPDDHGYVSLFLPEGGDREHRPRLHVATPYESDPGVFDRVLDVAKVGLTLLWDGGYTDGLREVEIIAEPLAAGGTVEQGEIEHMGFALGSTWLDHCGNYFFPGYTTWIPQLNSFEEPYFYGSWRRTGAP